MTDSELRFCRRLGLSLGIMKWWTIKDLHSPAEWLLQLEADRIDPIDANRDDMRASVHTMAIIRAIRTDEKISSNELRFYMPCNQPPEEQTQFPEIE